MTQLMYSPSDTLLNRSQLALVPTPKPLGNSHMPYAFADYVTDVSEGLDLYGLNIKSEEFVVTHDQQQFFGIMEITGHGVDTDSPRDFKVNVGLRGSHNQTLPRGLILGTQVIVCSNLCFHGNIGSFRTKQTTFMAGRLQELIKTSLAQIAPMVGDQAEQFDRFKAHTLTKGKGLEALGWMYLNGAFSSPQLTKAINEWVEPSYEEHAAHGWNLWRLFNAGTQALKPGGGNVNMAIVEQRSMAVSDYCMGIAA